MRRDVREVVLWVVFSQDQLHTRKKETEAALLRKLLTAGTTGKKLTQVSTLWLISKAVAVDGCRVKLTANSLLSEIASVFVRDCKECKLLVACQQFRTRDCKRIHIFLSCKSQPIIEASTEMYFGCYQCYYSELSSQFDRADLNVFHNCWDSVHDFTPVQEETNWGLIPRNVEVGQHISVPSQAPYSNVGISYDARKSVVPLTSGGPVDGTHDQEHCLVVLDSAMDKNSVHHLVQELSLQGLMLVRMKCFELDCEGVRTLFPAAEKSAWGSIIALDLCGVNAITISHQVTSDNVHVKFKSLDSDKGMSDVEALFNLSDFNMN
ncbi:protein XRP2-like isoform X2 [Corticium candelabrum]|uniref:protein XRP2-like isoform X2 n=1 Tax=Corticium candelabrum TaxID=121492 RepID=UPI002E26C234|nr:protein XRP2-like isoform X2 [Corticium candelabrum]